MRVNDLELIGAASVSVAIGLAAGDWLAGVCILALLIAVKLVWTGDGVFVLPIALSFHWMQGSLGVLYYGFTGRMLPAIESSDYRPMVLIALGCVLSMAAGIRLGLMLKKAPDPNMPRPGFAFSFGLLVTVYAITVVAEGALSRAVPDYPSLRQILVTFESGRLGVLFLILRRLCSPPPRFGLVGLVVVGEIGLGLTGYFAGFREPIVLAVLAVLEVFDRKKANHWMALAAASVAIMALGILWMGIRTDIRKDYEQIDNYAEGTRTSRANRVEDLTGTFLKNDAQNIWSTTDILVDRMWTIYYPALAIKRVPSVFPHTDGAIIGAALLHIVTPRVFFPNKKDLPSDSDEVRKYSGVYVAGREVNTSIAFGYSAESYIDFGVPLMFAPVFAFGIFVGFCYAAFRSLIWHRELFVAFATVSFWVGLYLFERSWATMAGVTTAFMVYLGGPIVLLDRFLLIQYGKQSAADHAIMLSPAEQRRA
ncbi:MAG TPA: hypothetical protein VKI43_11485 [Vicinamibacterales bacterium]|nr:hypothetical protein [Vicinamibacterales bacterium]